MDHCACCGVRFAPCQTRHESSLFGSGETDLCASCSQKEEDQIEIWGTNHIPALLDTYTHKGG
jgi:hypothetical protein